jgi:hypothetical protein
LRASAPIVVPGNGGSFDENNAGESNFALERTASKRGTLSDGFPRRRSARALGGMDTFPLRDENGEVFAFEMPNSYFITSRGVARYFSLCPGVSIVRVRRPFARDDVHVQLEIQGDSFDVWEPYGDNSRYWIGPSAEPYRRRPTIDALEAYVRSTWPGLIGRLRGMLLRPFSGARARGK